jgi:hypothetical protein
MLHKKQNTTIIAKTRMQFLKKSDFICHHVRIPAPCGAQICLKLIASSLA